MQAFLVANARIPADTTANIYGFLGELSRMVIQLRETGMITALIRRSAAGLRVQKAQEMTSEEIQLSRKADPNQMGLSSEDSVDYKSARAYAKKVGASNIEEAANGISRTLQFTAPGRVGEDGIYSQTELFGSPETGGTGTAAIEAGQKAAAALRKNKAPTGPSADLIAGLQGNWEELAREIDAKGRASFIFADLGPPRAISRKEFETRRLGKSEAAP